MVIYQCKYLSHISLNTSGDVCDSANVDIQECRGSQVLAVWAVGGEVSLDYVEACAIPQELEHHTGFLLS